MAAQSIDDACAEVANVRDRIQGEILLLRKQQMMLRAELQEHVRVGATRPVLARATKKLKEIEAAINAKEKLHSNVQKETVQLQDTTTNTAVATAMMRSVEAQRALQKLDLGGHEDIDEMLDYIEENRGETAELTDRLGNLWTDDIDCEIAEADFDASDVVAAMGMRSGYSDDLLLSEISEQLSQGWQHRGASYARPAPAEEFYSEPLVSLPTAPLGRTFFEDLQ